MSLLFSPLALRELTLRNRTVVAPMCQYSAQHGLANDWHFVHLGRFALGGFGLVILEATGVLPEARISYGDLGLWNDEQIAPLTRIVDFLHAEGSAAGIQLVGIDTPIPVWRVGIICMRLRFSGRCSALFTLRDAGRSPDHVAQQVPEVPGRSAVVRAVREFRSERHL